MQAHTGQPMGIRWGTIALVFGLVLACYWPALTGGQVWDDPAHVTKPELRSLAGLGRIWWDLHATQQYYPVLHSAFWVEHKLWGDVTLGYHLTNAFLHGTACCLLALLLGRLWRSGPEPSRVPEGAEWLAAILLAVHPVCVESVAWISEQKNTLSMVFYLLSAHAYFSFHEKRRAKHYAIALAFFLLALGTKTVTATLPAAILVVLWWKQGRLSFKRDALPLLPWFAASLVCGLFTAWVERTLIGASGTLFTLAPTERVLLAGRVIWFYVGKLLWPANLMFIYPRWDVSASATHWIIYLSLSVLVTVSLWLYRRQSRAPLAVWLLYVGTLFPALGFFNVYPFLFSYVADHFQYAACPAMISLAAVALTLLVEESDGLRKFAAKVFCVLLVLVCVVLSNLASRDFSDSETLYRATLAKNPECWMAHNNLAMELVKQPARVPEAIQNYRDAIALKPDFAEAHNNLANQLSKSPDDLREAISHYQRALQIEPRFAEARINLANALATIQGGEEEAVRQYREAIRVNPAFVEGYFGLANVLSEMPGRSEEAIAAYRDTLRMKPEFLEAHANFASFLATLPGHMTEARAHFEEALRLDPKRAKTHYNYGVALESEPGGVEEARSHYLKAVELAPNYVNAYNNLAVLCAKARDFEGAKRYWEQALAVDPSFDTARQNLTRLEKLLRK